MTQQSQCNQCANFKPIEPVTPPSDQWLYDTEQRIKNELARFEGELWQAAVIDYRRKRYGENQQETVRNYIAALRAGSEGACHG